MTYAWVKTPHYESVGVRFSLASGCSLKNRSWTAMALVGTEDLHGLDEFAVGRDQLAIVVKL